MKKNLIFACCVFLLYTTFCCLEAQTLVDTENLSAYVGTWVYKNSNETLKLYIKKGTLELEKYYGECLLGDYSYTKNGLKLDTYSIGDVPSVYADNNYSGVVFHAVNQKVKDGVQANVLNLILLDKRMDKRVNGRITLLSSTQIHLVLFDIEGEYDCDEDIPIEGFSIPNDITLNKVTPKFVGKQGRK
jgi:hypothetical protein